MKKVAVFMVVLLLFFIGIGCKHNEVSSQEEALFATQALPGFKEFIFYETVKKGLSGFHVGKGNETYSVVHVVVYRTSKDGDGDDSNSIRVSIWDDRRPPLQIQSAEHQ